MALLPGPCLNFDLARCSARQKLPTRQARVRPTVRSAATRGSESPNEEVLERLKRAEAEAADLRKQIAAAKVSDQLVRGASRTAPSQVRFKC